MTIDQGTLPAAFSAFAIGKPVNRKNALMSQKFASKRFVYKIWSLRYRKIRILYQTKVKFAEKGYNNLWHNAIGTLVSLCERFHKVDLSNWLEIIRFINSCYSSETPSFWPKIKTKVSYHSRVLIMDLIFSQRNRTYSRKHA